MFSRSLLCLLVVVALAQLAFCLPRLPMFPDSLYARPEFSEFLNSTDDNRIVGGEEAHMGQFKYQVSLQRRMSSGRYAHYCGASVLNNQFIITAAHCVQGKKAKDIFVLVGTIDITGKNPNASPGTRYNVTSITQHDKFNSATIDNDVALIKVDGNIEFSEYVEPVKILKQGDELPITTVCQVSGWGTQEEGGRVSGTLRFVNVPLVSDEVCKENYHEITSSMICAGLQEGGKDSCQGDSGGPMVSNGVLVGIVSWGYGCARPGYPGVYAEVAQFTNWISAMCEPNVVEIVQA